MTSTFHSHADLSVYTIGPDHLVARSLEDAWDVWLAHHGEHRENYAGDEMSLVPDTTELFAFVDERGEISDSGETLHLTARQWADREGRGFLFSTEY
jgi:hypothetical protein